MIDILSDYKNWLMDIVIDENHLHYNELFDFLFNIEFTWSVKGDENRAADGIHLRTVYYDQTGQVVSEDIPCNVLEMMVALSVRGSEDILWDGENNWTPFIFWTMVDNLGLIDSVDGAFDYEYVATKIDIFLSRKYSKSGFGGLFLPVPFLSQIPKKWEKTEIWYQMQNWLTANFVEK